MANEAGERAARVAEAASERIRDLTRADPGTDQVRAGAYERTLKTVGDHQEVAGQRGGERVTGLAPGAGASSPASSRRRLRLPTGAGKRFDEVTDDAARQARRVPGQPRAEGAVRGAAAREHDLAIANSNDLRVAEINWRLPKREAGAT